MDPHVGAPSGSGVKSRGSRSRRRRHRDDNDTNGAGKGKGKGAKADSYRVQSLLIIAGIIGILVIEVKIVERASWSAYTTDWTSRVTTCSHIAVQLWRTTRPSGHHVRVKRSQRENIYGVRTHCTCMALLSSRADSHF